MPSRKVTELERLTTPSGLDLIYVIDDVSGTPTGKSISINEFFGNIPANTNVTGTLTVSGTTTGVNAVFTVTKTVGLEASIVTANNLVLGIKATPSNSSISSVSTGQIFFDADYLYIKVANTEIKRAALSSF